jgi:hypothetical protein
MPTVAIDILFAGLMIFVPNQTDDPSSMMVYLLKQDQHEAKLEIYGDVCIEEKGKCVSPPLSSQDLPCSYDETIAFQRGRKIVCQLESIGEISFDHSLSYDRRFLRRGAPPASPATLGERRSLAWLARVLNFEPGASEANLSRLEHAGARLKVGWETARTCALDGGECNKVNLFEFQSNGPLQALAEEVMLTSRIEAGRFRVLLHDRNGREVERLRVECNGQQCASMQISNTLKKCVVLPDHFKMYYNYANHPTAMRTPVKKSEEPTGECADLVFQECFLRLTAPVFPALVASIRKLFAKHEICSIEQLRKGTGGKDLTLFKLNKKELPHFLTLVEDIFKIHDRIVCPPVILEP